MFTPSNLRRPLSPRHLLLCHGPLRLLLLALLERGHRAARERLEGSASRNSGCILLMLNGTPRYTLANAGILDTRREKLLERKRDPKEG